jgi:FkbM family methyltransferase
MNPTLKQVLKQLTPPLIVTCWKSYQAKTRCWSPTQKALKKQFEERNAGCRDGEMEFRDGLKLALHPDSRVPFEYFCYVSTESVEEMDGFLLHTQERQRLLDIGALHGAFSLAFAAHHPNKRAVAVDASPIAFGRLLYNLHKNRAGNITPVECALSDTPGTLRMHYEWEHAVASGTSSKAKSLEIEKRTGDDLCAALNFCPDVIKIDVEGHEIKVLRGLRNTIKQNRPLIFLEVHPQLILGENDCMEDLISELTPHAYQAAHANGQKLALEQITGFQGDQRIMLVPN